MRNEDEEDGDDGNGGDGAVSSENGEATKLATFSRSIYTYSFSQVYRKSARPTSVPPSNIFFSIDFTWHLWYWLSALNLE